MAVRHKHLFANWTTQKQLGTSGRIGTIEAILTDGQWFRRLSYLLRCLHILSFLQQDVIPNHSTSSPIQMSRGSTCKEQMMHCSFLGGWL